MLNGTKIIIFFTNIRYTRYINTNGNVVKVVRIVFFYKYPKRI